MDLNFNKNEDYNKLLVTDLKKRLVQIKLGGGKSKIEKEHAKGKLTARERIDYLLDPKSKSIEVGAFAGDGMYAWRLSFSWSGSQNRLRKRKAMHCGC